MQRSGRRPCSASATECVGTSAKTHLAINVAPRDLVFSAALVENAGFESVMVPYPAQVVVDVDRRIGLVPGSRTKIGVLEIHIIQATEADVGNCLIRSQWIEKRKGNAVLSSRDVAVHSASGREGVARSDGELIQNIWCDRANQNRGNVPTGWWIWQPPGKLVPDEQAKPEPLGPGNGRNGLESNSELRTHLP